MNVLFEDFVRLNIEKVEKKSWKAVLAPDKSFKGQNIFGTLSIEGVKKSNFNDRSFFHANEPSETRRQLTEGSFFRILDVGKRMLAHFPRLSLGELPQTGDRRAPQKQMPTGQLFL